MLSPQEAIGFKKCVMFAFDNPELVSNWERLRKRQLKGNEEAMTLFIEDMRDLIWERLPVEERKLMCSSYI